MPGEARGQRGQEGQERPGEARRGKERPGEATRSQERPGEASRRPQNAPDGPRSNKTRCNGAEMGTQKQRRGNISWGGAETSVGSNMGKRRWV